MDEKQPSKIATVLLRILMPINTVLIVLTLLLSLFVILEAILSSSGIILNFSNYGHSMEQTIRGNALVVIDTRTPYESLKVGDIILFKEPKGLNTATDKIRVHIHPIHPDSSDGSSSTSDSVESDTADTPAETTDTAETATADESTDADEYDEPLEYLKNRAVLHRIVEIKYTSTGEQILTTKGDANPEPDRYPVTSDTYMGRMAMSVDYIGEGIKFLYEKYDTIIVLTAVMSLSATVLRRSYSR